VIDARKQMDISLNSENIAHLANRRLGIGFDQLVMIQATDLNDEATAFMRIYNADGGEVSACGNATRCVAEFLMRERGETHLVIRTKAGLLKAEKADADKITVNMGVARIAWNEIPLAYECDTLSLPIAESGYKNPVAVSMGNPHAVFFVGNVDDIDLPAIGSALEHHAIFPERANIEFARIINRQEIQLRVWERGAGETMACGTGACATAVAAFRRGLSDRKVAIYLKGGILEIEYCENGEVLMTGSVATSFTGEVFI